MAQAGAGRAGAATSRAGKERTSGARNDTSGAAEELSRRHDRRRYAAIDRQHEPVTELGWEPLDACPGPGSGTAERLGDLLDSSPRTRWRGQPRLARLYLRLLTAASTGRPSPAWSDHRQREPPGPSAL